MKTHKNVVLGFGLAAITALTLGGTARAGVGTSGGGSGLVYYDGSVRLVDLRPDQSGVMTDQEQIKQRFFKKNRYVKTMAQEDSRFFDCAKEKIRALDSTYTEKWLNQLGKVRVLKVEFPLISIDGSAPVSKEMLEKQPVPVFAENGGDHESYQIALAAFSKGDLWIQKRFYNAMPSDDQCALAVHEAIRNLNFTRFLSTPMSTSEIEELTRQVAGGRVDAANDILKTAYGKNRIISLLPVGALIRKANNLLIEQFPDLKVGDQQRVELEHVKSAAENLLWDLIGYDVAGASAKELNELGTKLLRVAESLNDYRFKYFNSLSAQQNKELAGLADEFLDNADDMYTKSAIGVGFEVNLPENIWDRIWVNISLTENLPGLKVLDVVKVQIVNRLFHD